MSASDPNTLVAPPPLTSESGRKTVLVALAVCLVCSVLVAGAAVALKPTQAANQEADRKRNIVEVAGLMAPGLSVTQAFEKVDVQLIELATGTPSDAFDPGVFDIVKAGKDPALSDPLTRRNDVAQIKRKPKYLPVYRVSGPDGELKTLILPVYGYGLWSTLYGFLALEGDLRTVQGLKFYQHAETPGLGGEVDNPKWRALWRGKVVFDEQWRPRVELVKGSVDPSAPDAAHKIDGLAGATLTSRGVTNLLNFWLGDEGYAPYLARLRQARS